MSQMLVSTILVAVLFLLVGTAAGFYMAHSRRSQQRRHIPFAAVDDLTKELARGLAGEDARNAVEVARAAIGAERLTLIDTRDAGVTDAEGSVELRVEGTTVGAFLASGADREALRALHGLARLVQSAAEATELDAARDLQTQAQLLALKSQIRPHFIYNALNVIASFTVTDPERARTLLIEFADFTRYWFREHGPLASLRDELRAIEGYLVLERARYGERLSVRWEISPEALSTQVPHLCLQPLVENAVRHGIETEDGRGSITIAAHDEGPLTIITVEDDGIGMDPKRLADVLAGKLIGTHVGLRNIDVRLRQTYGDMFGLIVDTALGAGTLITVRVPKFQSTRR